MIAHLAALALAVATAPPPEPSIPPAVIDPSLEITGDSLAARQLNSRIFIDVAVNGRGPYRFLVDSGADRSVIGRDLAKALALPSAGQVRLQSVSGQSIAETVQVASLTIGRSTIADIVAPTLAEADLGAQGLIGIDALADQRLKFDFVARTITVQDTRRPVVAEEGEIVVTARRRNGQLILTTARVGKIGVHAVIDSGAEITIGNSSLRAALFGARGGPKPQLMTVTSVTGEAVAVEAVTLPRINIGGVVLENVPVAFADIPPFRLFGLDKRPALLLGSDLLQAFRQVSLDFRHRKVRFVLRR